MLISTGQSISFEANRGQQIDIWCLQAYNPDMNSEKPLECAKQFLEKAVADYPTDPEAVMTAVRRYAAERDTAEFSTVPSVTIACRIGQCAATLSYVESEVAVSAPTCRRVRSLTK